MKPISFNDFTEDQEQAERDLERTGAFATAPIILAFIAWYLGTH